MKPPLHAFWSYSRVLEQAGAASLHSAMRAALADPISLWGELQIFRDNSSDDGISPGADWFRAVVAAVARSTLFFWVQSPRWLRAGSLCSVEFAAFEDRLARVARHFCPSNATHVTRTLSETLLIPVRMINMSPTDWDQIDPALRQRYEAEWGRRQVMPELDFTRTSWDAGSPAQPYGHACISAAQPIARNFGRALATLGVDLATLNAFIQSDCHDFERRWLLNRALWPGQPQLNALLTPGGPAAAAAPKSWPAPPSVLGLSFFWLPDDAGDNGCWTATSPLQNRLQQGIAGWLAGADARGPGGFLLLTAVHAAALRPHLREAGLDLPDSRQAARLRMLISRGRDAALRMGMQSPVPDFWCSDTLAAARPAGPSPRLPLLLVAACTQGDRR